MRSKGAVSVLGHFERYVSFLLLVFLFRQLRVLQYLYLFDIRRSYSFSSLDRGSGNRYGTALIWIKTACAPGVSSVLRWIF
jgi:hypothetical protein